MIKWLVIAGSLAYLFSMLWIAWGRYSTPFELEWMEGGMLAHAIRLREGLPIYAPPSLDFVPFFYTPGYPALLYGLDQIGFPLSFGAARTVSVLSTIGTLCLIYYTVVRETGKAAFGLIGIGLYAALFRTCGAFYDLARPDSLMIFLISSAVIITYYGRHVSAVIGAAILISAAFFTKQTSAVFFPVMAGWIWWSQRRLGLIYITFTFALCSVGVWWMDVRTDGSFWSYIFEGHQGHVFYWKNILLKYWRDLLFLAPLTLLLPLLWFSRISPLKILPWCLALHWLVAFGQRVLTLDYRPHMYYRELFYEEPRWLIVIPPLLIVAVLVSSRQWGKPVRSGHQSFYWLWIYIAGAGASALNHSTQWAYSNSFMLIGFAFSLSAPMMLKDLVSDHSQRSRVWVWSLLVIQLIAWAYAPRRQLPQERDHKAWASLKTRLENYKAPIFFPGHPTYNALDRQLEGLLSVHTHQMGISDVAYRGGVSDLRRRLSPRAGEERTWSAVVTHERTQIPSLEAGYYEANQWRYLHRDSLRAKTGFLTRPQSLWLPRRRSVLPRVMSFQGRRVSLNFEVSPSASGEEAPLAWSSYGWEATGEAFGKGPSCLNSWRGEGRCGASTAQTVKGSTGTLRAQVMMKTYQHLSLLIKGELQEKRRGQRSHNRPSSGRSKLEVRLIDEHGVILSRYRVRTDHRWRRALLTLSPMKPPQDTIQTITVELIDQDRRATLRVDDLKIDYPLDR